MRRNRSSSNSSRSRSRECRSFLSSAMRSTREASAKCPIDSRRFARARVFSWARQFAPWKNEIQTSAAAADVRSNLEVFHEATADKALTPALSHPMGEGESSAVFSAVDAGPRFKVPMQSKNRREALHEPQGRARSPLRGGRGVGDEGMSNHARGGQRTARPT